MTNVCYDPVEEVGNMHKKMGNYSRQMKRFFKKSNRNAKSFQIVPS